MNLDRISKKRKKITFEKKFFRELRFFLINALIATVICLIVVVKLNSGIITAQNYSASSPTMKDASSTTAQSAVMSQSSKTDSYNRVFLHNVPDTAKFLDVSFDNQYYSYVNQGVLHILTLSDNNEIRTITTRNPITYALMLSDSDLIMYFYQSGASIYINTYNISTQKTLSYNPVKAMAGVKIVQVAYAVNTNLVYIVVRSDQNKDTVYQVNIMNKVTAYYPSVEIVNLIPSATSLNLYLQGIDNTLYYNFSPAGSMKGKNVKLLGRDQNDQYYLLSQDVTNQIYVLNMKEAKVVRTFHIPPGVQSFFTNDLSLYSVYKDRIIDMMADSATPVYYGVKGRFVAVIGKVIYFLPPK